MSPTFFEGPEKKFEIALAHGAESLRAWPRERWQSIVAKAQAEILSVKSSPSFDAYLLSESSLFVYDGHATMITCGRTTLVAALTELMSHVRAEDVALLMYERKNEHFPHAQHTSFYDDASRLADVIDGRALRFGDQHGHRIDLFHSTRPYRPDPSDTTLEILMHGLDDGRANNFCGGPERVRAAARSLHALLPGQGTVVDEYCFDPGGYSLNALCGGVYYTVHVTPEAEGSYASFETNFDHRDDAASLVARVVEVFAPESFDVFAFDPSGTELSIAPAGYDSRRHMFDTVCGYGVSFSHWFRGQRGPRKPLAIPLG